MSRARPGGIQPMLLVLLAVAFAASPVVAGGVAEHLPGECLAAVRLREFDRLDQRLGPVASAFGVAYPPLGELLTSLPGVAPAGEAVVGIVRLPDAPYHPFVLLPVADYDQFVRAGEGDPMIDVTPITLWGEELLATRRGAWALVTNPTDDVARFGTLDRATHQRYAELLGEESLALLVTDKGLAALDRLAATHDLSELQLATRRRLLRARPAQLRSLDYWRNLLAVRQPVVSRLAEQTAGLVIAADVAEDQGVALRLAVAAAEPLDVERQQIALPTLQLDSWRKVATGSGPWNSPWTELLMQLQLDSMLPGSDDVGVLQFSTPVFEQFRESVLATGRLVRGVSLVVIDPAEGEPTMSNSAYVVLVEDAAKFIESVDDLAGDWNRLIDNSERDVDFFYEIEPLDLGERQGKRYAVDLPSAFRANEVPDVRQVLSKLYGRNGKLVVDVLPIDDRWVLVSDLPDAQRDRLAERLASGTAAEGAATADWNLELDPAALQDWLNKTRQVSYGDNVVGWHPRPLECSGTVRLKIATHRGSTLTARAEVPGDVVRALGLLLRK